MPFPFVYICDLLDKIEGICVRDVPLLRKDRVSRTKDSLISWFMTHRWRINAQDTDSSAVLMMLKPEKQTDREYGLEEHLEQVLARIFKMPTPMYEKMMRWKEEAHNHGDLGLRLCQILQEMKATPSSATASKISAEEIDQSLLRIAIFNDRSSLAVRSLMQPEEKHPDGIDVLENLYTQLQPREAKWLTRIILKDHGPATLPDSFPLPGNVSHLPSSIPATFSFPLEPPAPTRRIGTRVRKGIGSNNLAHPLPTPPTSSPLLPDAVEEVKKFPPRIRIGWDPRSSNLSASVIATASSAPPSSSPLPATLPSMSEQHLPKLLSPTTSSPPIGPALNSIPAQLNAPRKRSALGQISSNIPSGSQSQQSQSRSQEKHCNTSSSIASIQHNAQARSQLRRAPPPPPTIFSTGKCLLTSHPKRCQFSSALLILSPNLLSNLYILKTLIPHHGAHHLTSLASLSHPSVPRRTKSGRRIKKFILVDITYPEQTLTFCKQAEKTVWALGWKSRNGNQERIPIFDWRVLESALKVDRGMVLGFDFVGKHFQGTI
ncbi:uncharacterized protein RAG0_06121 [Rhynchosporium agropyri]|uniref:DNA ligase ATP-dependent N-terminal domain-containing protein n=1 Tax=Rhynchosporium agropyri TaxID=914238 RepID=A0A1E1KG99_9HELO|nr:uncharacterized protein RAG0_06121 [Rhynchosporium agropyri]